MLNIVYIFVSNLNVAISHLFQISSLLDILTELKIIYTFRTNI